MQFTPRSEDPEHGPSRPATAAGAGPVEEQRQEPRPSADESGKAAGTGGRSARPGSLLRTLGTAWGVTAAISAMFLWLVGALADTLAVFATVSITGCLAILLVATAVGTLLWQHKNNRLKPVWKPLLTSRERRWLARAVPLLALAGAVALAVQPVSGGVGLPPGATDPEQAAVSSQPPPTESASERATPAPSTTTASAAAQSIPVGKDPRHIALLSDPTFKGNKTIFVTNFGDDTLSIITIGGSEMGNREVGIGGGPDGVAVASKSGRVYVGLRKSNQVVYRLPGRIEETQETIGQREFQDPGEVTVDDVERNAYIVRKARELDIISLPANDRATVTVAEAERITSVATSPKNNNVYIVNSTSRRSGELLVLDAVRPGNPPLQSITVGDDPRGMAISPDGRFAVVANHGSDSASIVDLNDAGRAWTRAVDAGPTDVSITSDSTQAYIVNELSGTLSVIDLNDPELTSTSVGGVGDRPIGVVIDAADTCAYVLDADQTPEVRIVPIRNSDQCRLDG